MEAKYARLLKEVESSEFEVALLQKQLKHHRNLLKLRRQELENTRAFLVHANIPVPQEKE
jgi:hypothetical protein